MLRDYIKDSWERLRRNALDVALDVKVSGGMHSFLYAPASESLDHIRELIRIRRKVSEDIDTIEVRHLPADWNDIKEHGILFLPNDYVVPGGRFNEMYGWDSYWIVLGLMHDGLTELARGMVENLFYQIENYGGKILNANRTYYLSRSQPPLLGPMVMAVAKALTGEERRNFLSRAATLLAADYEHFWKTKRYTSKTGLFHYGNDDQGSLGPCQEVAFGERDPVTNQSHYDKMVDHLRGLPEENELRQRFFDNENSALTFSAIAGDRGMRESGYDASMHMGYFGLETLDFNPVCLNSMLVVECRIAARLYRELGNISRAEFFESEATAITKQILAFCWDEKSKTFLNYNHRLGKLSDFPYISMVCALWAGVATPEQAAATVEKLKIWETPHGIKNSEQLTGCQWDAPFMWAPMVYFTVGGLANYNHVEEARRIARNFLSTVTRMQDERGAVYEKYNADNGSNDIAAYIDKGYIENVIGFGWTNGTALVMIEWLQSQIANGNQPSSQATTAAAEPIYRFDNGY